MTDTIARTSDGYAVLDYTLDDIGNVVALDESLPAGAATRGIAYDGLDRLTALSNGASLVQGFGYDATGNRTSKTTTATETYQYQADTHHLVQAGSQLRELDAAGNGTRIGSRSFTYDDRGRMSGTLSGVTLTHTYHYNGRGERVAKRNVASANNSVYFVYDEAGHLLGEYKANGTAIKEYLWLDDTLVAVIGGFQGDRVQYVLTDHLGTPRAAVHPTTDAIIWRWDLTGSAFGEHTALNDPDGDGNAYNLNLRYPGQYFDHETGLHYNYFRDYDPSTGRYVQSDPIGIAEGPGTYTYVGSRSFNGIDELGLLRYEVNGPVVNRRFRDGSVTPLFPGDPRKVAADSGTLGRTTMSWQMSARCECGDDGSFRLDEFSVTLTPEIHLRKRYSSAAKGAFAVNGEQEHVTDLTLWAYRSHASVQFLEDAYRSPLANGFTTRAQCESLTESGLRELLVRSVQHAATASRDLRHASGGHRWTGK